VERRHGRTAAGRPSAVLAALLAVAGGLLTDQAFPGTGWWPLAPVGVGMLLLAIAMPGRPPAGPGRGALLGLLWGLAFFVPHLAWSGIYVGAVPHLALAVSQAAFVAAFGAAAALLRGLPGGPVLRAAAAAALWVAVEAARARLPFGGFGWGRLAFSQVDSPLVGLAALGGAPLVSFAVALAGGALALLAGLITGSRRRSARRGPALTGVAVPLAAVAVLAVTPLAGAAVPRPTGAEQGTLAVAAVQGNVPRAGLDFNAERRAVLDNHADATRELAARVEAGEAPAPELVVWPENASDIDPLRNQDAAEVIEDAAAAAGAPLLLGAVLREPGGPLRNVALVWQAGQGPVASYAKVRPVPFGEYMPYRSFFRMLTDKVDLVPTDFAPGDRPGVLAPTGDPLGVLICFEVVLDDLVADTVDGGARLLVVQTNNATFGLSDESVQQLAMSRLRAVEHGRAVVHASTVGVSALVAPDGSVLASGGLFTREVLSGDLPLRTSTTLATRLGGWPEAALAAGGVLAVGLGLVGSRRQRGGARPGAGRGAGAGDDGGARDGGAGDGEGLGAGGRREVAV
jgi:apolipoprotein N-acyltransferase